jgi:hypothetical protein
MPAQDGPSRRPVTTPTTPQPPTPKQQHHKQLSCSCPPPSPPTHLGDAGPITSSNITSTSSPLAAAPSWRAPQTHLGDAARASRQVAQRHRLDAVHHHCSRSHLHDGSGDVLHAVLNQQVHVKRGAASSTITTAVEELQQAQAPRTFPHLAQHTTCAAVCLYAAHACKEYVRARCDRQAADASIPPATHNTIELRSTCVCT